MPSSSPKTHYNDAIAITGIQTIKVDRTTTKILIDNTVLNISKCRNILNNAEIKILFFQNHADIVDARNMIDLYRNRLDNLEISAIESYKIREIDDLRYSIDESMLLIEKVEDMKKKFEEKIKETKK